MSGPSPLREVLAAVTALFRRTWTGVWRRPVLLTFSLGQPLVWMLFFGFLFERYPLGSALTGSGSSYLDFLAPGVSVMTVLFGASQSGIGWVRDLQTGFLQRLLATPAPPGAILAGKVLADVARLLLQAGAVLLLALLLGAHLRPAPGALFAALLGLALFAAAACCLSCALALRARAQEVMAAYVHLVNLPLLFTSTALVPGRHLPDWLAGIARWNPLTLAVEGWRGALLGGAAPPARPLLVLALLCAGLFLLARSAMRQASRRY